MALLLLLLGALFCWLLYKSAVYALPYLVGFYAGQWAHETGAGWTGAVVVAFATAIATFLFARAAFAAAPSPAMRLMVAIGFATPTLAISYNIAIDLLQTSVPSLVWRNVIAGTLACLASAIALQRLTEPAQDAV